MDRLKKLVHYLHGPWALRASPWTRAHLPIPTRDRPSFQAGAGPAGIPEDKDGAQEDDDMADVMDFFL